MFEADKSRMSELVDRMDVAELRKLLVAVVDAAIDDALFHIADNGVPYWTQTGESLIDGMTPEWND